MSFQNKFRKPSVRKHGVYWKTKCLTAWIHENEGNSSKFAACSGWKFISQVVQYFVNLSLILDNFAAWLKEK